VFHIISAPVLEYDHASPPLILNNSSTSKMVRAKKAASGIKAPSRAKPTIQSDTDDSRSVSDDRRKTKASASQDREASGSQRQSKKPAPRPRQVTTEADVDGDAIEEGKEEEEEDEDNNDGNDSNDPVEDNDDQENNDDVEEEEEEEEEDTYEAVETKMLKLETKLHLLEIKKKKSGGSLNPQDERQVRRLTNDVRELRERLAKEEPASDDATAGPGKKWWAIHGIIRETAYHYLIVWKGEDEHGQP
jgi:hypothetical protein